MADLPAVSPRLGRSTRRSTGSRTGPRIGRSTGPAPGPGRTGRLGRSTGRSTRRAALALGVIALWLGLAAIGGPKIGELSTVQSNNQATALPATAESVRAGVSQQLFAEQRALPAFVVFTAAAPTADQRAAWAAFITALPQLGVRDTTLSSFLQPAPILPVPAQDGTSVLAVLPLLTSVNQPDETGVRPLADIVATLRTAAAAAAGDGGAAHIAGPAGLSADLGAAFAGLDGLLLVVTLIVVLSILVLVYRAFALPIVVLFNSVCGLALAGGIVFWLADADTLTLNGQSQGILFILVVGAATDYGLLLVARYREELTRHEHPAQAMLIAWRSCLAPVAASATTVIAGLLCLLLSNLATNRSLGPVGAIGVASAALAALTLLPALLLGGRWLFWPRIPRLPATMVTAELDALPAHGRHSSHRSTERIDAAPPDDPVIAETRGLHDRAAGPSADHPFWAAIARFVDRRPRQIWIVTAVALLLGCLAAPSLRASGATAQQAFLNPTDSVIGQEVLQQHFSGLIGDPVVVITAEDRSARVLAALDALDSVDAVTLKPDRTGSTVVVDGLVLVQATIASAVNAQQALREIRLAAHTADPDALVGGTVARQVDTTEIASADLRVIIPTVLLVVLIVLTVLLRSLVAPILLVAATVLSFGAALGVSALVFNHLFEFPGSDPAIPLFAFVFLVALGVDYSIFLMSRAREEVLISGPRDGVLHALSVTGGVITSAGVVLAATFAALSVIPLIFLVQIAFIVAFGVLLDTLVVRTLLVPALALELGRFTWWPSALSRAAATSSTVR